jgi:hypothetical protein|tara:strand:+ start:82 stop:588 length:507 start_codon:yes stop_codon:yes gene_type:complete
MANPLYGQNKLDDRLDLTRKGKAYGVVAVNDDITLTSDDVGKLIVIGTAAKTVTLPSAETGMVIDVLCKVETNAGSTVIAASGDCFFGTVQVVSSTDNKTASQQVTYATATGTTTSYDNFDLDHDATTLGGHVGDRIQFIAIDDTAWLVDCVLTVDGNPSSIAVINAG